jgi:hypothetical protein
MRVAKIWDHRPQDAALSVVRNGIYKNYSFRLETWWDCFARKEWTIRRGKIIATWNSPKIKRERPPSLVGLVPLDGNAADLKGCIVGDHERSSLEVLQELATVGGI